MLLTWFLPFFVSNGGSINQTRNTLSIYWLSLRAGATRDGAKKRKPPPKALQNLIYRCFQILFKFLGFNLKDPPPSSISTLHRPEAPSNPITTP